MYRLREFVGVFEYGSELEVGKGLVKLVFSYFVGGSERWYIFIGK